MESESPNIGQSISGPTSAGGGLGSVPLFHAAWLFAAGIAVTEALWLRPGQVLVALALMASLCCVAALRAQRIVWLPLAALWILLGAWCAEMEPQPAPAPALAALSDGLLRTVEGTVTDAGPVRGEVNPGVIDQGDQDDQAAPKQQPAQRIDLHLSSAEVVTDTDDAQKPVDGGVRLTVRWPQNATGQQAFQCGERIRAVVRLLPPEVYHDPGVWSRQDFLVDQGITSSGTVSIDRVERLGESSSLFLACRISGLQHASSARLLALPAAMHRLPAPLRLSEDDAIMLAAMVTGDRTYLTHSLRVGFERTGSFHMLVVSGFHLAIVAGCLFWVARRLRLPRVPATLLPSGIFRLRAFYRLCHARAALALDGHAIPAGPASLPRAQRAEHHRICRAVPAGCQPAQPLRRELPDDAAGRGHHRRRCRSAAPGHGASLPDGSARRGACCAGRKICPVRVTQFRVLLRMIPAAVQTAENDRFADSIAGRFFS